MAAPIRLQLLYRECLIRIDAQLASNLHRCFRNLACRELCVVQQSLCRRLREWTAAADRSNAAFWFDYVTLPADQEGLRLIGDQQQGFQMS
jgi:hypothetical protein